MLRERVEREGGELLGDFESECSVLSLAALDLNLAAVLRKKLGRGRNEEEHVVNKSIIGFYS